MKLIRGCDPSLLTQWHVLKLFETELKQPVTDDNRQQIAAIRKLFDNAKPSVGAEFEALRNASLS